MKEIFFGTVVIVAAICFGRDFADSYMTKAFEREGRRVTYAPAPPANVDFSNKELLRAHRRMGRQMSDNIIRMNSPNTRIIRRYSDDD